MSSSSASTVAPPIVSTAPATAAIVAAPAIQRAVTLRVAAIREVFATYRGGQVPWVLYENGTTILLAEKSGVTDRNQLIAAANEIIKDCRTIVGTPLGDFNTSVWKNTIPVPEFESKTGTIFMTMFPAFEPFVIDVIQKEPAKSETIVYGHGARGRKDQDVAEQRAAATSVDTS